MDTFVVSVCPLDPDSPDFWDVCALYAPFLHQLTMQSSLFERGCPVSVVVCVARKLHPCPSYSRCRDRINLGLWRSLYKGGGRSTCVGGNTRGEGVAALALPHALCTYQATLPSFFPRFLPRSTFPSLRTAAQLHGHSATARLCFQHFSIGSRPSKHPMEEQPLTTNAQDQVAACLPMCALQGNASGGGVKLLFFLHLLHFFAFFFCICLAFNFLLLWQSMDEFVSHAPF